MIIGAGSVVRGRVAPGTVAIGNPAKPVSTVAELYEKYTRHGDTLDVQRTRERASVRAAPRQRIAAPARPRLDARRTGVRVFASFPARAQCRCEQDGCVSTGVRPVFVGAAVRATCGHAGESGARADSDAGRLPHAQRSACDGLQVVRSLVSLSGGPWDLQRW